MSSGLGFSGNLLVTLVLVDCKSLPCQKTSPWALKQLKRQYPDGKPSRISSNSMSRCERTKSFPSFQKLPLEIRNLIWKESLPEPRIFDDDTIRPLGPQHGVISSELIPGLIQACHDSRTFAQSHLTRTVLSGRTIYFNPECDIYRYRSPDLLWRHELFFTRCLFSCIEIFANVGLEQLPNALGSMLRSAKFHNQFPNLKKLLLTDQQTSLHGDVLWNGCSEEQWLNQHQDDQEWRLVQKYFERRNISITISSVVPQIHGRQISDIRHMPGTLRNDIHTNSGLSPKAEPPTLLSTLEAWSLPATPSLHEVPMELFAGVNETSQAIVAATPSSASEASQHVNSGAVVCHEWKALTPDPDITPGPAYLEYRRADGRHIQRVRSFSSSGQSFAGKLPSLSA